MRNRGRLVGWRYGLAVGSLVGFIGLAIYPIIIQPVMNPEQWKEQSIKNRQISNIRQEDIQPGGMKVWSDPFDRKK